MAVTALLSNVTAGTLDWTGLGAPEGFVTADIGDTYRNRTAGTLYVKTSGNATNTGWTLVLVGAKTVQVPLTLFAAGTLTAAADKARVKCPVAGSVVGVYASVLTAPTGAAILVDIHKAGTTLFTTQANRPSIAISGFDSLVAVPDVTAVAAGDILTVDVDQVGSSVAGANLLVAIALRVTTE